ncbi:hypothetical protein [Planktothrix pseudagardhii]|uniref:ParB/Sulfiredoxin domain-containing protein n=1 Tax=Planktothrix pseudagardhii TaxID=132604 RepID=A0A9W4CGG6_9CYAN|nr:hypothetical protein [Planktothrix pseudagardhii]CAD5928861.1 hypothetical protein NO713_01154 [Planktothrix pseudagardhii]
MSMENTKNNKGKHFIVYTINNKTYKFDVFNLWNFVSGMKVEEVPIKDFNLDIDIWFREFELPTVLNVIKHCQRMLDADLDFPIIIAPNGIILDGMHRIGKAWILGYSTIKAIRLEEFPISDLLDHC